VEGCRKYFKNSTPSPNPSIEGGGTHVRLNIAQLEYFFGQQFLDPPPTARKSRSFQNHHSEPRLRMPGARYV